jgi:hypothetical protein
MQTSSAIASPVQATSTQRQRTKQAASAPTEEEIRCRAYEIYLERGAVSGGELDDWVRAERELNRIALYNRSRRRVSIVCE